jgi:hypothetical protein
MRFHAIKSFLNIILGRPADLPYVTGDFLGEDFGGVIEPYWVNTDRY